MAASSSLSSSTSTPRLASASRGVDVAVSVASGASIHARGVGRRFVSSQGPVDACRDIDLDVPAGSFTVIVGPSGCGKSTFLRMLAGLDRPTSGVLALDNGGGGAPSNAMVFQGRSLFPWLTLRQNVSYGLKMQGVPRKQRGEQADALLATVGLHGFRNTWPHQVSEGMRQRVAIARALAVDPDLLLMDEPFGALDEQTRFLLQEELLRIWEASRKTVVFVTHSIDEAIVLADRIVIMSAQPGTVRAVVDVPFARPRGLMDVRSDPAFAELFGTIWTTVREEVTAARVAQEASMAR